MVSKPKLTIIDFFLKSYFSQIAITTLSTHNQLAMHQSDTLSSTESHEPGSPSIESQDEDKLFELVINGQTKAYRCSQPDCGKIFRFRSEMKRHVVIHYKDRPYTCSFPKCRKTYKRIDALNNHFKTHTVKLSFICTNSGCDETFSTKSSLNYHLLKHEGLKMFKCSYPGCSRSFLTQAQLKQHEGATTYHKRIFSSTDADQTSPKPSSSHNSEADTFLASEEFSDFKNNDYDLDYNEQSFSYLDPSHKDVFNTQFQNDSLNTLSDFLDRVDKQCIGITQTPDFVNNHKTPYTDAIRSKFINFMNETSRDDKDLSEKIYSCTTQLEQPVNLNQNLIHNCLDIDLFFKSS